MIHLAVEQALSEVRSDDAQTSASGSERLFQLLYTELRSVAAGQLRREKIGHTLQPTALVHEAYVRMADQRGLTVCDRSHFLAIAARAMRQILVQHARHKGAAKRGGGADRVTYTEAVAGEDQNPVDLLALDIALDGLAIESPRMAQAVEMRFFGGLSTHEVAEVQGVSVRTVGDDWRVSRLWLKRELA